MKATALIVLASLTGSPPVEFPSEDKVLEPPLEWTVRPEKKISQPLIVCTRSEATWAIYNAFRQLGPKASTPLYRVLAHFGLCQTTVVSMHPKTWLRCRYSPELEKQGCGSILLGMKGGKLYFAVIFPRP